ncbi:MAG TPA: glycoside hydrolase family 18 protein [Balneolales bacterium]|nr:glycoside hydrolase family 18 protein [Balneolales bacterium]
MAKTIGYWSPSKLIGYSLFLWIIFGIHNDAFSQKGTSVKKQVESGDSLWVSAYLASWNHYAPPGGNWGNLPTNAIDWNAFTQLIYFALPAKPDGQVKPVEPGQNVNPDRVKAIIAAAHSHGKPVLISIGGWGHYKTFSHAITDGNRSNFVTSLVQLLRKWNFDGIDLDMEPIKNKDVSNYQEFIKELHRALQKVKVPVGGTPLLTVVTRWQPEMFAKLYRYFDQVNLMTYDLSGAWHGWVSWYNSAIYDAGHSFPGSNKPLPSVNQIVEKFIKAGVPRSKLGIGIDFYGYIWKGVSKPGEGWTFRAPKVKSNVPYTTIMEKYYQQNRYRWNNKTESAYLTVNDGKDKLFITYDSKQTVKAKVHYAAEKKLGGIFIWELSASYFRKAESGEHDELLDAVKSSVNEHSKDLK